MKNHSDKIVEVPISEIRLTTNPKIHPDHQIKNMMESIQRFGFTDPCLITPSKILVAGYCRFEAARRLGFEKVPCRIVRLDDEEIISYILSEGRIAEQGTWDYAEILNLFERGEFSLTDVIGWTDEDIERLQSWSLTLAEVEKAESQKRESVEIPQSEIEPVAQDEMIEVRVVIPQSVFHQQKEVLQNLFEELAEISPRIIILNLPERE